MTTNGNGTRTPDRRTVSTDRRDRMAAVAEQIGKRAATAPKTPTKVVSTPRGWVVSVGPYRTKHEAEAAREWIGQSFYDIAHLLVCIRDGISAKRTTLNGSVAANIRSLRTERGWSQGELGSRVSVTNDAIQKIEAGRNLPSLATALALSETFGVSIAELIGQLNKGR